MSISVSSSSSLQSFATANASSKVATAQPAPQSTNNEAYVVRLSEAQQVGQLYQQGQQVSQIASSLSLTVQTVNSYLGITSK